MTQKKLNGGGRTLPEPQFQVRELSLDQILERGVRVSQVLNCPIFQEATDSLVNKWIDQLLESEEHEAKKRESLYLKQRAFTEAMDEFVGIYKQAKAAAAGAEREEQHDADYPLN